MSVYKILFILFFVLVTQSFAGLGKNPIVLVHGYGPRFYVNMLKYKSFLVNDGVNKDAIFLLDYPQLNTPDEIVKSVKEQLSAFLSKFPEGTKLDLITHSYGNFVGLYAPLEAGMGNKVENFIGLAGISRGIGQLRFCKLLGGCGKTLPLLTPFMSPFVVEYLSKHANEIERYNKCSLYSESDKVVADPPDSGALPGGKIVEVVDSTHMDFIHSDDLYSIMKTACYGVKSPDKGFEHEWRFR